MTNNGPRDKGPRPYGGPNNFVFETVQGEDRLVAVKFGRFGEDDYRVIPLRDGKTDRTAAGVDRVTSARLQA